MSHYTCTYLHTTTPFQTTSYVHMSECKLAWRMGKSVWSRRCRDLQGPVGEHHATSKRGGKRRREEEEEEEEGKRRRKGRGVKKEEEEGEKAKGRKRRGGRWRQNLRK